MMKEGVDKMSVSHDINSNELKNHIQKLKNKLKSHKKGVKVNRNGNKKWYYKIDIKLE